VRAFNVTTPTGARDIGSLVGKALNSSRLAESRNVDVEKIVKNRPVAKRLIRISEESVTIAARG